MAAPLRLGYCGHVERAYDAVVVGSGFGGGVTACRLAEAGLRVCVLERGRRFAPGDFPDRPEQARRLFWHRSNPGGLFDVRLMKDLVVITAAGVGGGSLVYATVQFRAPRETFETGWPAAITRDALDPYYDRTEEAFEPREVPADPPLPKVAAFAAAARGAGRQARPAPLATYFGEDRRNPFSGVAQSGCENLGRCNLGCPRNAMNTVAITYLARAEASGAEVLPLREALRLDPPLRAGGRWRIGLRDLHDRSRSAVEAPLVVLSAGCLGSTRLMLANRGRLPGLSRALGTRFSGNGDALGVAFDPRAPDVTDGRHDFGPVMTSFVDYDDPPFVLANGGLPANFSGLLEIARGVSVITGPRRWLVRAKSAMARVGLGDRSLTPREGRLTTPPPITDALVLLMIGRDAANGRMRLTPLFRRLDISWRTEDSQPLFDAMRRATEEIARGADAVPFFALDAGPLGKFSTTHPLGGCPMADDPAKGVVDDHGQVHGYQGLYVVDGSIMPTALGANPSKTIAALAERSAEHLLATRGP